MIDHLYEVADKKDPFRLEDIYFTGILPIISPLPVTLLDIFPWFSWRPKSFKKSMIKNTLMILELNRFVKNKSPLSLWNEILSKRNKENF